MEHGRGRAWRRRAASLGVLGTMVGSLVASGHQAGAQPRRR